MMPRARDRFGRVTQMLRWCEHQWPLGRRLRIEWRDVLIDYETGQPDPKIQGQTYRDGAEIVIELKRVGCRQCLMATAMHEYGHAHLWGPARAEHAVEPHPRHFWTFVGEIEDLWNEIGSDEADDYEAV